MSDLTYDALVLGIDKPLVWLRVEVKTPPFSAEARLEAGGLLRQLQRGALLSLPHSRPMPAVGPRCHELRINDKTKSWRIMYRIDADAIVIVDVFEKRTQTTPAQTISLCKQRLKAYDQI
jgi:phage-related protein